MSDNQEICPICEEGVLELAPPYTDTFEYHGEPLVVSGLESYVCPLCGADPIFTDQIKRNERRILEAKRQADGLLTGEEIRRIREGLRLTQRQAAEVFGGGAKAFTKYESGVVMQSAAMDSLLRLIDRYPGLLAEVAAFRGAGSVGCNESRLTL